MVVDVVSVVCTTYILDGIGVILTNNVRFLHYDNYASCNVVEYIWLLEDAICLVTKLRFVLDDYLVLKSCLVLSCTVKYH